MCLGPFRLIRYWYYSSECPLGSDLSVFLLPWFLVSEEMLLTKQAPTIWGAEVFRLQDSGLIIGDWSPWQRKSAFTRGPSWGLVLSPPSQPWQPPPAAPPPPLSSLIGCSEALVKTECLTRRSLLVSPACSSIWGQLDLVSMINKVGSSHSLTQ